MKVCMIVPGEFPSYGGLENLVYSLTEHLAKIDVEVFVLAEYSSSKRLPPSGVKVYAINVKSPLLGHVRLPLLSSLVKVIVIMIRVLSFVRRNSIDIIHAHQAFPSLLYALLTKVVRRPIICTSHGADIQVDEIAGYGIRRSKLMSIILSILLKLIYAHVVVSKSMVRDALCAGTPHTKIHVLYNGIDLEKIPRLSSDEVNAYLRGLRIHDGDFIILFLSRLHPKKQPELLLKALPEIVERVPNAKLVLAGPGDQTKLKLLARKLGVSDRVIFTGFVSDSLKWALLKRCDIFVLPSRTEAFGIALVEAMACGKPVVVTRTGPFPEIVDHGKSGFLVPLGSPSLLADAVVTLASNAELRSEMGVKAAEAVAKRFDIKTIAAMHMLLYKKAILGKFV